MLQSKPTGSKSPSPSPFYVPVDLGRTALILSDIQEEILARFTPSQQSTYLTHITRILIAFRASISTHRSTTSTTSSSSSFTPGQLANVPLIVHHVLPWGLNHNSFISPYNKLASWSAIAALPPGSTNPLHPSYRIPSTLIPSGGFGSSPDEIVVSKLQAGGFGSSELLCYLRARGVRHVVLCGLTTAGSVLGGARGAADLDFHTVVVMEGCMDDDGEVGRFLLERVLSRFVDVVGLEDVLALFEGEGQK